MPINLIVMIVYVLGVVISGRWMWGVMGDEMKATVIPTAFGPFPPAFVTVAATALLWPLTIPLHLISLVRKKFGWISEFEKRRMK